MDFGTKAALVGQLLRWRFTWAKHDSAFRPAVANPKFMSALDAAKLIPDGATVMSSGMAANMRCSTLFWGIREAFLATGHPGNLTWISAGGQGGRGRVPGTVEEIGVPGLLRRFISGHHETARAILKLAEQGRTELLVMPQGIIARSALAQSEGQDSMLTPVGVGTMVDPRVGAGSQVLKGIGEQLVEVEGDGLRYRLPKITAAVTIGTAADEEGNIYMRNAVMQSENWEAAMAARKNGGVVLCTVTEIVPKGWGEVFLTADQVDAIVVNPRNEQAASIPQHEFWPEFVPGNPANIDRTLARLKFFNNLLKLDPARGPVENVLARMTAQRFTHVAAPGSHVIIGYGLPQEAGRLVHEGGLSKDITFLIETGIYGGIPSPGMFFGMAVAPQRLMPAARMFEFCMDHLDVTILGMLQTDTLGNVNVSKKGPGPANYVGPGGFIDLCTYAKNIVFVGNFQAKAQMSVEGGKLSVTKPGIPKFVEHVDEVTFYAPGAVARGQKVAYVTNVGTFELTAEGLVLKQVVPGVDVRRDIVGASPARIIVPEGDLPVVSASIMTGDGFKLAWGN